MVKALIGLFKAFAERERSKAPTQAVDPTQLRVALGNLEGDKFRVGMQSLDDQADPACCQFKQRLCLADVAAGRTAPCFKCKEALLLVLMTMPHIQHLPRWFKQTCLPA